MTRLLERYGPWAVVAGASEGIGAAFARALAAEGFKLVLIARRADRLQELAASLPVEVETVAMDLGAAEVVAQLEGIGERREIGLLVYNAALSTIGPFLETPLEEKLRAIDVNARGPVIAAHVLGGKMAARGRGGIVLLSSLTAFWGTAWIATYGATKAFNLGLGEALSIELGESGVDVVVSCAGATETPGFLASVAGKKAPRAMTAEAVARETLKALPRRGAFVPGWLNRIAQWVLARVVPRSVAVRVMAGETRKLLR